jgi:hypothetical protein
MALSIRARLYYDLSDINKSVCFITPLDYAEERIFIYHLKSVIDYTNGFLNSQQKKLPVLPIGHTALMAEAADRPCICNLSNRLYREY